MINNKIKSALKVAYLWKSPFQKVLFNNIFFCRKILNRFSLSLHFITKLHCHFQLGLFQQNICIHLGQSVQVWPQICNKIRNLIASVEAIRIISLGGKYWNWFEHKQITLYIRMAKAYYYKIASYLLTDLTQIWQI